MPTRGHYYTRDEIKATHGGSDHSYLPRAGGRIVCACLRTDAAYNPDAPRVILPGRGDYIEESAAALIEQRGSIPVYLKRASSEWEYVGDYEVERSSRLPADLSRYKTQTGRAVTSVIFMKEAVGRGATERPKDAKKVALLDLSERIRSRKDWWLFPEEDPIQGFMGTDPIFIVGDQPSTSEWPQWHPNRRAFYEHLQKVGLANAHLTDLYKKRGRSGALSVGPLPDDFHEHLSLFRKEIEILQPTRIVALGCLAQRLLNRHIDEWASGFPRMWHFSYVVRYGKISLYEANMRRALNDASRTSWVT